MTDQQKTSLLITSPIGSAARSILPADLPRLPGSTYTLLEVTCSPLPCSISNIVRSWEQKGNLNIP